MYYIIENISDIDLAWSNENGWWTYGDDYDVFTPRKRTIEFPIEGGWRAHYLTQSFN
jgi:hypothetical protein